MELLHDSVHKINRLYVACRGINRQKFLFSAVFLDYSPVGVFRNGIGGKPGLHFSWNTVVFRPCGDLCLDVVKRENATDYRLVCVCGFPFEFIVLANIGFPRSVELACGEGLAYSVAHSVLFSTARKTVVLFIHFQICANKFIL